VVRIKCGLERYVGVTEAWTTLYDEELNAFYFSTDIIMVIYSWSMIGQRMWHALKTIYIYTHTQDFGRLLLLSFPFLVVVLFNFLYLFVIFTHSLHPGLQTLRDEYKYICMKHTEWLWLNGYYEIGSWFKLYFWSPDIISPLCGSYLHFQFVCSLLWQSTIHSLAWYSRSCPHICIYTAH
jgi:hypothetical protein